MGAHLSAAVKAAVVADLVGGNLSVRALAHRHGTSPSAVRRLSDGIVRPPCDCGRPCGHGGHCHSRMGSNERGAGWFCRKKGDRLRWTAEAEGYLREHYPLGTGPREMRAVLGVMLGRELSAGAMQVKASYLGLKRPLDRIKLLQNQGYKVGRPAAVHLPVLYVKRAPRGRPASQWKEWRMPHEADACFAYMIAQSREADRFALLRQHRAAVEAANLAVQRERRLAAEVARPDLKPDVNRGGAVKSAAQKHAEAEARIAGRVATLLPTTKEKTSAEVALSIKRREASRLRWAKKGIELKPLQPGEVVNEKKPYVHPAAAMERAAVAALNRPREDLGNVLPTARADPSTKGVRFSMLSSKIDPFREARLAQALEGSRGRI